MRTMRHLAACVGVIIGAAPAHAHHAWAAVFTEEYTEIEGYVTEYNFKNPHVNIMLSVTDEDGVENRMDGHRAGGAAVSTLGMVGEYRRSRSVRTTPRQNEPHGRAHDRDGRRRHPGRQISRARPL